MVHTLQRMMVHTLQHTLQQHSFITDGGAVSEQQSVIGIYSTPNHICCHLALPHTAHVLDGEGEGGVCEYVYA